ncbi:Raf kinase inhibitor-like YbhB/YbcL family protein [Pseudomonas sp. BIGb0278]|uniref:YbhB/YbcL family Raf kinase inhibitor-like protein n=1 Tax=Pseudomonas sp. BIGb0278 TaxID=2940607 RepID=UPI002168C5A9|nr:YbhB/YbcL family Raf kinase inhibitor-like protein [Pseudomonas sp. BIGb0278]MCS4285763.1 Raf kinase inhibitor-like YbhB/YbcL family protein [Pseudomonas sp. BIGb0278]
MNNKLLGLVLASSLAGASSASYAQTFTLHSPELEGGKFGNTNLLSEPYGFGCAGGNVSPSFTWSGAPAGTKSFVLTIYDRNAPTGVGWMHWVVANIPGDAKGANLPAGALQPRTDFGVPGYGGPCPPKGSVHDFEIILTAVKVDALPMVTAEATPAFVGFFTKANSLGEAKLTIKQGHRPDSLYGLSKCFAEDLGQYYWDKFGIESVNLRIGSSFEEPLDRRMLATWLSFDDFAQLVERSLLAPRVAHMIVYGMSANRESLWDNRTASSIGYVPKDTADDYREKVEAKFPPMDMNEPAARYHGGDFAGAGHFEDPK